MISTLSAEPRNPFDSAAAREHSDYSAWRDRAVIHPLEPGAAPRPRTELVHHSLRALILNPRFSCVGAKAAVRKGAYRFGTYPALASAEATAGLARDLWEFVREQPRIPGRFSSFIASFDGPVLPDELGFEHALWDQLQRLHEQDQRFHEWDPTVSSDPDDTNFSFSFAWRAFFVVGLHPASSRWSRRFAWPTLVFNAHEQFEKLRAEGRFERFRDVIRARERALQGSINPVLRDFGDTSEARQYSGRHVEAGWKCPFHAHTPEMSDE